MMRGDYLLDNWLSIDSRDLAKDLFEANRHVDDYESGNFLENHTRGI